MENKIYTEKRVNYDKLHSKLPILRVNYNKLHSKLPFFRIKSEKNYTGQKKFTRAPPVAPLTNMRYEEDMTLLMMVEVEEKVMQDKKHRDDKIRLLMLKFAEVLAQIALDLPLYDLVGMGLDQLNSSTLQN